MADSPIRSALINGAVIAGTFVVGFAFLEVGLRVVNGVPAAPWSDWRAQYVVAQNESSSNRYDETLGWVLRDNLTSHNLNTIEHGIRINGPDTVLTQGAVLAAGDSFTAGSEVGDTESWPAHLEDKLGRPVMNSGVGGYGTDQIVLRAEQLMDILQPEIVVLSFFDQDILRAGYSRYGENKPYFVDTPAGIELKHVPVPAQSENKADDPGASITDNLYLPAVVRSAVTGGPIYIPPGSTYRKVVNDPVAVSCALLNRIKKQTVESGVHLLLVLQYGGQIHHTRSPRPGHAELVIECATSLGIPVVDEFDTIRQVSNASSEDLRALYVMGPGDANFGHMSSAGNDLVAGLIAEAINDLPAEPTPLNETAGFGPSAYTVPLNNLLTSQMQALDISQYSNGLVDVSALWWGQEGYTFSAKGPTGEHYLSLPALSDLEAGRYEIEVELRAGSTDRVRLQLLHSVMTGVLADIDLGSDHADLTRLGPVQRIGASVKDADRGSDWKAVNFHAAFTAGDVRILIQFLDSNGSSTLPGDGTNFDIANIRLNGFVAE
ncbi:hypothetical protein [Pyruvatibacter sp.]|uniref:hypothetical protein n=1 Tax=Pyruvatibacter sp. TaxID=1981328 RepID=UPI003264D2EF